MRVIRGDRDARNWASLRPTDQAPFRNRRARRYARPGALVDWPAALRLYPDGATFAEIARYGCIYRRLGPSRAGHASATDSDRRMYRV